MTNVSSVQPTQTQQPQKPKRSIAGVVSGARKGWNNTSEVSKGIAGGAVKGIAVGTAATAFYRMMKTYKESGIRAIGSEVLAPAFKGMGNGIASFFRGFGRIFAKENPLTVGQAAKNIASAPFNFVGKFFKADKSKISIAAKVGIALISAGVAAYSVIKSKLNANEKNANVDHRWRVGHDDKVKN